MYLHDSAPCLKWPRYIFLPYMLQTYTQHNGWNDYIFLTKTKPHFLNRNKSDFYIFTINHFDGILKALMALIV